MYGECMVNKWLTYGGYMVVNIWLMMVNGFPSMGIPKMDGL